MAASVMPSRHLPDLRLVILPDVSHLDDATMDGLLPWGRAPADETPTLIRQGQLTLDGLCVSETAGGSATGDARPSEQS